MDQIKESRSDLLKKIYDEFILKKQSKLNLNLNLVIKSNIN
jgi:hypothetical protein